MKLNVEYVKKFVEVDNDLKIRINEIHEMIHNKNKPSEFLGWLEYQNEITDTLMDDIIKTAREVRSHSKVLVVVGIGGSYAGSKAGIEFLENPFIKKDFEVIFAGHHMSTSYMKGLLKYLEDKDFSVNVISKSGTTTEPAIAFRLLKKELIKKYGKQYYKRIIATTDGKKGSLFELASKENFKKYIIPDNIGGRYSVLTPVGLFPFAFMDYDIKAMIEGAKKAYNDSLNKDLSNNSAYLYAAYRYLLYKSGKKIEMLVNYDPNLSFFAEWWKQLFGESEGKDHKGLFVASANFSTDLHSLGQYIQEGERHLFETVLKINNLEDEIILEEEESDLDNLNYLKGKSLQYVNDTALKGTMLAHVEGLVPNILIEIDDVSEFTFGKLVFFFMISCAISAYLIEVDPFNQPGVEKYKTNMFALLGKPGYEDVIK